MCNLRTILLSSSYLQGVLNKQLYLYFYHVFRVKCAWVGVCVRVFYPAIIGQSWVWHKELWIQKPNLIIVVFHDKGVTIQNISIIKNGFVLTWIDICQAVAFIAFTCSSVVYSSRQSSNSSCHSSIKCYFCCSCLCLKAVSQLFLLHIRCEILCQFLHWALLCQNSSATAAHSAVPFFVYYLYNWRHFGQQLIWSWRTSKGIEANRKRGIIISQQFGRDWEKYHC